jgi:7-carboxy-7-deazaguanine synthase
MSRPSPANPPHDPPAATPAGTLDATLPIAETFTSIQGEGRLIGMPSHFIRVSGCNLRCAWCDTPYASWKPEGVSRRVHDLARHAELAGVRHVVLTGGEPMLFPAIVPLTEALRDRDLHITIETAGTIDQPVACDLMSISPKLSNSTPGTEHGESSKRHEERRINLAVLQSLINRFPSRQLKFVVSRESDLPEIDALLARLRGWTNDDVFLMPEGVAPPDAARRALVLDLCRRRTWRYAPRLHIDLFGHTRGT